MWIQHQETNKKYWSVYERKIGEYWFFHRMNNKFIELIMTGGVQTYPYIAGSRVGFDYGMMPLYEDSRLFLTYDTDEEKDQRWVQLLENPLPFIIEALN